MGTKFGGGHPYQQNPLERREIIEASHEAAIQVEKMLGHDANFHAQGAQPGQHASNPVPKENQSAPQEIKLFLHSRETTPREDLKLGENQQYNMQDNYYNEGKFLGDSDYYTKGNDSEIWTKDGIDEEKHELITDILKRRAAYLYMVFQPPEPVEGPADTLFIVRRSSTDERKAFIRAHSQVLKRMNDAFDELIGCTSPLIPTALNTYEREKIGMQNFGENEHTYLHSTTSMYSKILDDHEKERHEKYLEAIHENERDNIEQNKKKDIEDDAMDNIEVRRQEPMIGNIVLSVDGYAKEDTPNVKSQNEIKKCQMGKERLKSRAFLPDGRLELGLENVIGSLQDSIKPSLVKEFLEACQNLVQLPGWEHLPDDLQHSFEKFTTSIKKFKNEDSKIISNLRVDGRSSESTSLGMVCRRKSKDMLDILDNISERIFDRRASKILLDKVRHEELEGITGNDVSAKTARTTLERKKSQAYLEDQQRRQSVAILGSQDRVDLVDNRGKRISPSFLERRQKKVALELITQEKENLVAKEIYVRRKNSKAAIVAFERRKRMSVLEDKTKKEVEFKGGFDGEWPENVKEKPPLLAPRQRVSSIALGLSSGIANTQSQRLPLDTKMKFVQFNSEAPCTMRGSKALITDNQRVSESFLERKASTTLIDMKLKERDLFEKSNASSQMSRHPSHPPPLKHTREEDKDEIIYFYEDEDMDIYNTSSSSSTEIEPSPLPKDVEFVIEKMHWTADVLHALMEFIYTETTHIHCEELPDVYRAANEILLCSLTDTIRLKPINQYFRLAMVNDNNREALLNLAIQLTTSADYQNYVNKNEDFVNLKKLCESFELDGELERRPYTLLLETGHVAFRNLTFVTSGLHKMDGHMVLILKDPRARTRLFEQNLEQNEYLTFQKKFVDRKLGTQFAKRLWLGQWPPIEKTRNRDKSWKVYFFDFQDLMRDIPLKNFAFYNHISSLSMRPIGKEEFSVRLVCGLLICPVLYKALYLAFPELVITMGRGAGYYLGGETHGQNITMTGLPLYLLQACKSLPKHMVGRTVLRVSCPCARTFVKLWMSTNRFGADLECNVLYFLKPLIQIQKILEHWFDLDIHSHYVVTHPREMVELVEPHDPF